jgi:hypothetical protein
MNLISLQDRTCWVSFSERNHRDSFISKFHKKIWQKDGKELDTCCIIQRAQPPLYLFEKQKKEKYITNREKKEEKEKNLEYLELHPPLGFPNGNVGTPLEIIHANVNKCKSRVSFLILKI